MRLVVASIVGLVVAKLAADWAAGGSYGQGPEEGGQVDQTGATAFDLVNPLGEIEQTFNTWTQEASLMDRNTRAFLDMISVSEGTNKGDSYRVCYGYRHTLQSFADHPAITGEWSGERLSDSMCRGAGLNPGCVSTAAGRYQIIRPTWVSCKRALGLVDFSPESQDRAAIYLIDKRGALADVKAGRVADAIEKCRKEWASLPGAGYGQGERQLSALVDAYENAGGVVA